MPPPKGVSLEKLGLKRAMNPFAAEFPADTELAREHERAAKLLKDVRAGDASAIARFRYGHPRFAAIRDHRSARLRG